jgi:glycosyltransferase involved in cell wall biosynthesis
MNSKSHKVTIGMCVYNPASNFLSIIDSWRPHLTQGNELLIYDDGSETPINKIVSNQNDGIRIIRSEKNKGIGYGRNVIYSKAENDIIMFADSDDISYPNRIAASLEKFFINSKKNHANLVYVSSVKKYETGQVVQERIRDTSLDVNELIKLQTDISAVSFITPASVLMFSRLEVNTFFDESFRRLEDVEWLWHINTKMPINLISTDEILVERYDQIIARNKADLNYESEKKLFDKYSSIIGIRLTGLNLEWSRIKRFYFENKKFHLLCYCLVFILKYNSDAVRKIVTGTKRRLIKC